MVLNTKYRTDKPELMDDFTMEGEILREALDKIALINALLGGNNLTLFGIKKLIQNHPKEAEILIVDVGCGNGDMLRYLADYALKNKLNFKLTGLDANDFTINHARNLSKNYANISYRCENIFANDFKMTTSDIVLCTLTLHHFKDDEIMKIMPVFYAHAALGIVINDLHRSRLAYRLFQLICLIFRLNVMSRKDGLVSILRGFKKKELIDFSKQLGFKKYNIEWKWAFRYQWIISKI